MSTSILRIYVNDNKDSGHEFKAPGYSGTLSSPTWNIQPGTMRSAMNQAGNYVITFDVFVDYRQGSELYGLVGVFETQLNSLRALLSDANWSNRGLKTRRILLDKRIMDGSNTKTARIVNGAVIPLDNYIVSEFGQHNAQLFTISLELLPWVEVGSESTQEVPITSVSQHGGIIKVGENLGADASASSTDGRITKMSITIPGGYEAGFRRLWIGIRPGMIIDKYMFTSTGPRMFSQIPVNLANVHLPTNITWNRDQNVAYHDGQAMEFSFLNLQSDRDVTQWTARYGVDYKSWDANAETYEPYMMPGRYHLLARADLKTWGERIGDPKWGVRFKLVHGQGEPAPEPSAYRVSQTTPAKYLPELGRDGVHPGYYDFGALELGNDMAVHRDHVDTEFRVVCELALLGSQEDKESGVYPTAFKRDNWIRLDDHFLIPAESFLYIELPRALAYGEQLDIYTDDFGEVTAYIVKQVAGFYDDSVTRPKVLAKVSKIVQGENGFFMPRTTSGMVLLADAGPERAMTTSATFEKVTINWKRRQFGGIV